MTLLEFIDEFIFRAVEAMTILLFNMFFLERKNFLKDNKFKSLFFIVFFALFSYWATKYIPKGLHTVVHMVMQTVLISYILQSNIYSVAVSTALYNIMAVSVEVIVLSVMIAITGINIIGFNNSYEIKFYGLLTIRVILLGIIYILYKKNIKIFKFNIMRKEYSSITIALFNVSIMIPVIIASVYFVPDKNNSLIYTIFILLIFLLTIILNMLDFKEREKMLKIKHKFEAQDDYVKNMETVIDIIRREKHDFVNHLNTILAICALKKPDSLEKIKEYIAKLTNSLVSSYQFYNTGNDYIDGLLAVKSNYAFENGIKMNVCFEAPLSIVDSDSSDLISIFGNLIDNAFEAMSSLSKSEDKKLTLRTYTSDGKYHVSISNNGPAISEIDLPKIFDNGYSTKTEGQKERGYGLYITRQLVKRNSGNIDVYSTDGKTEFILDFSLKSEEIKQSNKEFTTTPEA